MLLVCIIDPRWYVHFIPFCMLTQKYPLVVFDVGMSCWWFRCGIDVGYVGMSCWWFCGVVDTVVQWDNEVEYVG